MSGRHLRALLHYDEFTGVFSWRVATGTRAKVGRVAGWINHTTGHRDMQIEGRRHQASRLAWLYMTGTAPEHEIDHINGDPLDDRFVNLREATRSQNEANTRGKSRLGRPKGVQSNHKRWMATITVNYKCQYLGTFDTPEEAHAAYIAAAQDAFGEFARFA